MDSDLMTIQEAAEEFKISRVKIWRWVRDGRLTALQSGRDLREKLVRRSEVEALLAPTPIRSGAPKKVAA
jgi:excisionase family DNA binding protein